MKKHATPTPPTKLAFTKETLRRLADDQLAEIAAGRPCAVSNRTGNCD